MLLYKYRPWNEFAEKILTDSSIFYPSKKNLNDLAELIHPIKFKSDSHKIFGIKTNQLNGDKHRAALLLSYDISTILKNVDNHDCDDETKRIYSEYLSIADKYQRVVEATYDQIDDIHDAFFYYAVNQYENAKSMYCSNIEAVNRLNGKLDKFGILSLSSKSDCPVMWAHYAANHTGVIFILDSLKDTLLSRSRRVDYFDNREEITLNNIQSNFYKKATDWAYEQEYRVLVKTGDCCNTFTQNALVGIILGIRMDIETRKKIISVIKDFKLSIDVYQAESSLDTFKIGFKKISE